MQLNNINMKKYYLSIVAFTSALYPVFAYLLIRAISFFELNAFQISMTIAMFMFFTVIFGFAPAIKYFVKLHKDKKFSEKVRNSKTWK